MVNPELPSQASQALQERAAAKEKTSGVSIIAGMKEIGGIILRRGVRCDFKSRSGRLDAYKQSLSVLFQDGTNCKATLTFPTNERMMTTASVSIHHEGPAPEHYRASEAIRKSVILFGNTDSGQDQSFRVNANKFFHPDAKEFEKPRPAETELQTRIERVIGGPYYKNEDGLDTVIVIGPIGRLGEKTLKFAAEFVTQSLELLREFDQAQPTAEPTPGLQNLARLQLLGIS